MTVTNHARSPFRNSLSLSCVDTSLTSSCPETEPTHAIAMHALSHSTEQKQAPSQPLLAPQADSSAPQNLTEEDFEAALIDGTDEYKRREIHHHVAKINARTDKLYNDVQYDHSDSVVAKYTAKENHKVALAKYTRKEKCCIAAGVIFTAAISATFIILNVEGKI